MTQQVILKISEYSKRVKDVIGPYSDEELANNYADAWNLKDEDNFYEVIDLTPGENYVP